MTATAWILRQLERTNLIRQSDVPCPDAQCLLEDAGMECLVGDWWAPGPTTLDWVVAQRWGAGAVR